jgi:hypothetical protein
MLMLMMLSSSFSGSNTRGVTLIIDQRHVHFTPRMFSCHKSHSWIFDGNHFLVKNP